MQSYFNELSNRFIQYIHINAIFVGIKTTNSFHNKSIYRLNRFRSKDKKDMHQRDKKHEP